MPASVLMNSGVQVGLLPRDIEEALSGEVAAAVVTREEEHARRAGIRSVPTFLEQGEVLGSGAQPEHLLAAVQAGLCGNPRGGSLGYPWSDPMNTTLAEQRSEQAHLAAVLKSAGGC